MKKVLITGGPVHAYLDDVKIITNRFRGGLMASLADDIHDKMDIVYLTSKCASIPIYNDLNKHDQGNIHVIYHNGIDDYMNKVLDLTPQMDAVVLGAAVANLIPKNKIEGKFPSHNYKPGDTIPIDFTIAPRIIDEVKKINPNVHLFGFKLLSKVSNDELIKAAYGVLLESKAVTIFANDTKDLTQKFAVTKERGVHPMNKDDVAQWIYNRVEENYYKTFVRGDNDKSYHMNEAERILQSIIYANKNHFIKIDEGYVFGSVALRYGRPECWGFVTTARGKNEIEDFAFVDIVKHDKKEVYCITDKKASLNAPLFHYIFTIHNHVDHIQHFHYQRDDLITLDYATPGTYEDTARNEISRYMSFNIKGHGCIMSFDEKGNLLK